MNKLKSFWRNRGSKWRRMSRRSKTRTLMITLEAFVEWLLCQSAQSSKTMTSSISTRSSHVKSQAWVAALRRPPAKKGHKKIWMLWRSKLSIRTSRRMTKDNKIWANGLPKCHHSVVGLLLIHSLHMLVRTIRIWCLLIIQAMPLVTSQETLLPR